MTKLKSLTAAGKALLGHPAGHDIVHAIRRLRRPVPRKGVQARRLQDVSVTRSITPKASTATSFRRTGPTSLEGAKVLVFDPIDSTVGAQVESYAAFPRVKVIKL